MSSKQRLTITSDGTATGTKVTRDDGSEIQGVIRVNWEVEMGDAARAKIFLALTSGRLTTNEYKYFVLNPKTGQSMAIKGFIKEDGTQVMLHEGEKT